MLSPRTSCRGFTFIELVVAISISAVFITFAALFIRAPVDAYLSQSRHAELLDSAAGAWPHMERDLHCALPNSVRWSRTGSFEALEMLSAVDSARYMTSPPAPPFTTAGLFRFAQSQCPQAGLAAYRISINNRGAAGVATGEDAYQQTKAMSPAGLILNIADNVANKESTVTMAPHAFGLDSPRRRAYVVSGPVTYLCDEGQGTIRRYSGYAIAANQASLDTPAELAGAGAASVLIARNVTACRFRPLDADANHGQVVTARITATRDGESVTMLHQAEVEKLQ